MAGRDLCAVVGDSAPLDAVAGSVPGAWTSDNAVDDGEFRQGSDGAGEDVINPATEETLAFLPHASKSDLDRALESAGEGFKVWRDTSAYERGKVLWKAGELIRERADAIGRTLTMEEGKTLAEAVVEANVAADIFQWYAEEGRRRLSIECLEVLQTVEGIERFGSPGLPGGGRMNCARRDSVRLTPAYSPSTSCSRAATSSRASSSITSGGRSRITVGPAGSASTPRSMSASMCGRARSLSSMPIISPI